MILRPYQETILNDLRQALRHNRAALVCAPPGAGKGSLIAFMVQSAVEKGKRIIFAVRGRELVRDMSDRVSKLGIAHGVLMGGQHREAWHSVQVASVDTLHRMSPKPPADLIILDEARQFMNATGRKVLKDFPESCKIVGADGTPALINGSGLGVSAGGIFDVMIVGPDEQELINMGFLVPSIPIGIESPPDLTEVTTSGGDFNQQQLATVCDRTTLVGDLVENWKHHAYGLKTVAFGVNQQHARHITEEFQKANIEWGYVDATTRDDERRQLWERLDNGTLMGFSNVAIAGVGFDHPRIQCVLAARPTKSLPLWRQMMGRASRPYPGKKFWILLDHAGNIARHFPFGFFETPPVWTLDGPVPAVTTGEGRPTPISMCKRPVLVPVTGVPASFTGPLSDDKRYMLPSFHYFKTGPERCPYCGLQLRTAGRDIEVEAGSLVDLRALREAAKAANKYRSPAQEAQDMRLKVRYLELAALAAAKSYKPGFAGFQLHTETNRWPSKAWIEEAKALYPRNNVLSEAADRQ